MEPEAMRNTVLIILGIIFIISIFMVLKPSSKLQTSKVTNEPEENKTLKKKAITERGSDHNKTVISCPYCGEEILAIAKKCKHCGSDLDQELRSKNKSSPLGALILVVIAILLFLSNFHVITGGGIGFKIVRRNSFGLREIFIDVDAITNMPWLAAESRYPIGCTILQREGIIESDKEFRNRIDRERKKEFEKAMKEVEAETDKALQELDF